MYALRVCARVDTVEGLTRSLAQSRRFFASHSASVTKCFAKDNTTVRQYYTRIHEYYYMYLDRYRKPSAELAGWSYYISVPRGHTLRAFISTSAIVRQQIVCLIIGGTHRAGEVETSLRRKADDFNIDSSYKHTAGCCIGPRRQQGGVSYPIGKVSAINVDRAVIVRVCSYGLRVSQ